MKTVSEKQICFKCRKEFNLSSTENVPHLKIIQRESNPKYVEKEWKESIFGDRNPGNGKIYPENGILFRYLVFSDQYTKLIAEHSIIITPLNSNIDPAILRRAIDLSESFDKLVVETSILKRYAPTEADSADADHVLIDSKAKNLMLTGMAYSIKAVVSQNYLKSKEYYLFANKCYNAAASMYTDYAKSLTERSEYHGKLLSQIEPDVILHTAFFYRAIGDVSYAISQNPEDKKSSIELLKSVLENMRKNKISETDVHIGVIKQLSTAGFFYQNEIKRSKEEIGQKILAINDNFRQKERDYNRVKSEYERKGAVLHKVNNNKMMDLKEHHRAEIQSLKNTNLIINIFAIMLSVILSYFWIWFVMIPFWMILVIIDVALIILGLIVIFGFGAKGETLLWILLIDGIITFGIIGLSAYIVYKAYTTTKVKIESKENAVSSSITNLDKEIQASSISMTNEQKVNLNRETINALSYYTHTLTDIFSKIDAIHDNCTKLVALDLWKQDTTSYCDMQEIRAQLEPSGLIWSMWKSDIKTMFGFRLKLTVLEKKLDSMADESLKSSIDRVRDKIHEIYGSLAEGKIASANSSFDDCKTQVYFIEKQRLGEATENFDLMKRKAYQIGKSQYGISIEEIVTAVQQGESIIKSRDIKRLNIWERFCSTLLIIVETDRSEIDMEMETYNRCMKYIESELSSIKDWANQDFDARLSADRKVPSRQDPKAKARIVSIINGIGSFTNNAIKYKNEHRYYLAEQIIIRVNGILHMFVDLKTNWEELYSKLLHIVDLLKQASGWAVIDMDYFNKKIDEVKRNLMMFDTDMAKTGILNIEKEIANFDNAYRPSLKITHPADKYQKETFEEVHVAISNDGNAIAEDLTVVIDGPADFSIQHGNVMQIPRLRPNEKKDLIFHMAFLRDGNVPMKISIKSADHNKKALDLAPQFVTLAVVKEKSAVGGTLYVTPKGNVLINAKPELRNGFLVYKLAIKNGSDYGMAETQVQICYKREIISFHHLSPATLQPRFRYTLGETDREDILWLGYLDPKKDQEVTVELYYHPYICTETTIEAELRYKDVKGNRISIPCEPKKFSCYCPTFESVETPNPAMVLSLFENSTVKDQRTEPIAPGVSLTTAFETMRATLMRNKLTQVGIERSMRTPFHNEALFYGEEEIADGKKFRYAIICIVDQKVYKDNTDLSGIATLHIGCDGRTRSTALLATLTEQFNQSLERQVNIKRPIYMDMRQFQTIIQDSVLFKSHIGQPTCGFGETRVTDSVVDDRMVMGSVTVDAVPSNPIGVNNRIQKFIDKYYQAYKRAKFNDGVIDLHERSFLNDLIEAYGLSSEIIKSIETKVEEEYKMEFIRKQEISETAMNVPRKE